jgi:hypothetical protein
MVESDDLFGSEAAPASPDARIWCLATNQRNLFFMLAAGLIMPPSGFGKKYYQDSLAANPGWIPLFPQQAPKAAVQFSIEERSHLVPCVLEMNLAGLAGEVWAMTIDGSLERRSLPHGLKSDEQALFVPAPIPVTMIASVVFQSKEDKIASEADAKDFGNVPMDSVRRTVSSRKFNGADAGWGKARDAGLPERRVELGKAQASGAIMAMLLQFGNLGQQGVESIRMAFDTDDGQLTSGVDPIIADLHQWMWKEIDLETQDVLQKLFWGAVEGLVDWRSRESALSPLDVILDYLAVAGESLDERMRNALAKLANDLRKLAGVTDSTVTELFERHPKPFSRVMTLFFLRESCAELLEFRHPLLGEADYLAASVLFGARDGWIGLPTELRNVNGLSEAVPTRMAALVHQQQDSGLEFRSMPARPKPVRELMEPGPRGWRKGQREVALLLAREGKWPGVQTRITLGKGDYRMEIDGRGMHLILDGEAKAVQTEIDHETFFRELATRGLSNKQDAKMRSVLKVE